MIQVSPRDKIFIAIKPVDFRIGLDSAILLSKDLRQNHSPVLFLYLLTKKSSIKILAYDGQGMWLMQKRLSEGKFTWWPSSESELAIIDPKNFIILLFNGDTKTLTAQKNWRNV
ncbi:MAG: IS66 family insertion sequence element accessory protein TnpB [Bacteriovoracaceae bacterium]|nr:IS66 family insertion sequence element accessory protein TnpB [Bacteriovoracaceae bacterium]